MAHHPPNADKAKRTANRLAQQKFRRHRKDYIAQLESELAMCRAGASEELVQRRLQMEQLTAEKKTLRDMLTQVAHTLGQACGLDVTLTPRQQGAECSGGLLTPQREDAHGEESGTSPDSDLAAGADLASYSAAGDARDGAEEAAGTLHTAMLDLPASEFDWLQAPDVRIGDAAEGTMPVSPVCNGFWPMSTSCSLGLATPTAPPQSLTPPNKLQGAQLACVVFRRQVDDVLDSGIAALDTGALDLKQFEHHLVQGIVQAISHIQQFAARALNVQAMPLSGGAAWLLWHVAKSNAVLPRLAAAGFYAKAAAAGYESDLFHETGPEWLQPTALQMTTEHHPAIDYIPWPQLRDALIVHSDPDLVERVLVNVIHRTIPSGANVDMIIQPNVTSTDLRPMFTCKEERAQRTDFYSTLNVYKLRPASIVPDEAATSYLVDRFMEQTAVY